MPVDEIIATYIECTRWANDACKCTTGERSSYGKSASLNFCGSQLSIPINQADSYPGEGSTLHRRGIARLFTKSEALVRCLD